MLCLRKIKRRKFLSTKKWSNPNFFLWRKMIMHRLFEKGMRKEKVLVRLKKLWTRKPNPENQKITFKFTNKDIVIWNKSIHASQRWQLRKVECKVQINLHNVLSIVTIWKKWIKEKNQHHHSSHQKRNYSTRRTVKRRNWWRLGFCYRRCKQDRWRVTNR